MGTPFDNEDEAGTVAVAVEPDADVDVDTAPADDVETETLPPTSDGATNKVKTATKKTSASRPPVPEGFVSPVQFAKDLSKHLTAKAREKGEIEEDEEIEVKPQIIYSYIRSTSGSKNPFPTHAADGRAAVIKVQEGLDWWDEKDNRVAARKANAAEKAAKKEAAPAEAEAVTEAEATPVIEAE